MPPASVDDTRGRPIQPRLSCFAHSTEHVPKSPGKKGCFVMNACTDSGREAHGCGPLFLPCLHDAMCKTSVTMRMTEFALILLSFSKEYYYGVITNPRT